MIDREETILLMLQYLIKIDRHFFIFIFLLQTLITRLLLVPRFYKIADMQASERKRSRNEEEEDDEVPLHILLELIFNEDTFIPRELMENLLNRATRVVPLTLLKPWRKLKKAIEDWMSFQFQCLGNQEHHEDEASKIYNPLRAGHCNYEEFLSDEELSTTFFPQETAERLRQFVTKLLSDLSSETPLTASQQLHSTQPTPASRMSTPYTTAVGLTEAADATPLQASYEDQTALQFGLLPQQSGILPISSHILIVNQEVSSTLKWEEPTGVATVHIKQWDNSDIQDSNNHELWKYCKRNYRVQLHGTTPAEVWNALDTLNRYAHEKVQKAGKSVKAETRKNQSTTGYGKTRYRH